MRPLTTLPLLALLTVLLSGCIGFQETSGTQAQSMGLVNLKIVACPDGAPGCSATSNRGSAYVHMDDTTTLPQQILLGVRLPDGTAPAASLVATVAGGGTLTFTRSTSYEAQLQAFAPAPAGERWWGWLSDGGAYTKASPQFLAVNIGVPLPRPSDGGPFPGQLPWRPVIGTRSFDADLPASRPVTCGDDPDDFFSGFSEDMGLPDTVCADAPTPEAIDGHLNVPVIDFGVTATPVQAPAGGTVTTTFLARRTGAVDPLTSFALSVAGGPPGATVTIDRTTTSLGGDAITPVQATIAVPAGTAPGDYPVTLTATAPGKAVRAATSVLTVPAPVVEGGAGAGGGRGESGGGAVPDVTAPVLTASLSRTRFRAARAVTPTAAAVRGTTLRVVASEPASLQIRVERLRAGRRTGGACRAGAPAGPRCTAVAAAGKLTRALAGGPASNAFTGRLPSGRLRPGRYRLSLVAVDAAGNRSARARLPFRIVHP
ncbi:MAG TPA: hypothetical protein VE526_01020 [Solirubrobacteraceae bacterium]|nr:hypothetical protein [Solirubrobacteraceae bacterium]